MMIKDKLDHIVTVTKTAGIPATIDPPRITPPGAWISARRLSTQTFPGYFATVADVYLIARDTGIIQAIETLDDMLETIIGAIEEDDRLEITDSALDESVTLPHGAAPLPAYRLTLEIL
nr:MAG TPA: hypothetical protein [Caudoviricetes sp.]